MSDYVGSHLVRAFMQSPIAAVIPAEPGWRVVRFRQKGDEQELYLEPIAFWAIEPSIPCPKPLPKEDISSLNYILGVLGNNSTRRDPLWPMSPLDAQKKRYDINTLHAWVGPDETDEEVLARVSAHITKDRKNAKGEP